LIPNTQASFVVVVVLLYPRPWPSGLRTEA
jgi:hypothetical protein